MNDSTGDKSQLDALLPTGQKEALHEPTEELTEERTAGRTDESQDDDLDGRDEDSDNSTSSDADDNSDVGKVEQRAQASSLFTLKSLDIPPCPIAKPTPFDPGPEENRPYKAGDPQDSLIPRPSFVSDFVYAMKGCESPVLFNIWSALYAVSVMSARKARFRWKIGNFFPNLFLLLVGPPAGPHKGAAMGVVSKLLTHLPAALVPYSTLLSEEKKITQITDRATSEGIFKAMAPKRLICTLESKKVVSVNFGSRAYVWASEFGTFLNSKKYVEGLVDALAKWYDCEDEGTTTLSSKSYKPLKDIYFCLAGAFTPAHLQKMPAEAFTGGLMSRIVLVNQERPYELFSEPIHYDGYPTEDDLLQRLAYLSFHARGEYAFSDAAAKFYHEFYMESRERTLASVMETSSYARLRHEHLVIRVAMLLRMAEYEPGNVIEVEHIQMAIRLLEYTYAQQRHVTETVGVSDEAKEMFLIRGYLERNRKLSRSALQKKLSRVGIMTRTMDILLEQLHSQGDIRYELEGKERSTHKPSKNGDELYIYIDKEG